MRPRFPLLALWLIPLLALAACGRRSWTTPEARAAARELLTLDVNGREWDRRSSALIREHGTAGVRAYCDEVLVTFAPQDAISDDWFLEHYCFLASAFIVCRGTNTGLPWAFLEDLLRHPSPVVRRESLLALGKPPGYCELASIVHNHRREWEDILVDLARDDLHAGPVAMDLLCSNFPMWSSGPLERRDPAYLEVLLGRNGDGYARDNPWEYISDVSVYFSSDERASDRFIEILDTLDGERIDSPSNWQRRWLNLIMTDPDIRSEVPAKVLAAVERARVRLGAAEN